MNYKKGIWLYLIKNGSVITHESFYGMYVSPEKTDMVRNNIHDIDWDKTSEVTDGYAEQFAGTFVDPDTIKFIQGDLVMKNGEKYVFRMDLDSDWSFTDCVKSVLLSMEIEQ